MQRTRLQYTVPMELKRLCDLLAEYVDGGKHQPGEILLVSVAALVPRLAADFSPGVQGHIRELLQVLEPELKALAVEERTAFGGLATEALVRLSKEEGQA